MTTHTASCRCGQLRVAVAGDPVRVSVCHCLNCKKRTGSAFAVQGRWPREQVSFDGESKSFTVQSDSGNRVAFNFCPNCGTDVFYDVDGKFAGTVAVPLGAFDDPYFVTPGFSVWESRKHDWVDIVGPAIEHN